MKPLAKSSFVEDFACLFLYLALPVLCGYNKYADNPMVAGWLILTALVSLCLTILLTFVKLVRRLFT